jgi:hypothetical protein
MKTLTLELKNQIKSNPAYIAANDTKDPYYYLVSSCKFATKAQVAKDIIKDSKNAKKN